MATNSDYLIEQSEVAFSFICEVANKFSNVSFTSIVINKEISIPLQSKPLDVLITETLPEHKGVLLFIYTGYDKCFDNFFRNIQKPQIAKLVCQSFSLIGWDVRDPKYHPTLKNSLETFSLNNLVPVLNMKSCCAFLLVPIDSILVAHYAIRETASDKDILQGFFDTCRFLEMEEKGEIELEALRQENQLENDIDMKKFQQMMVDFLGDRDYDCFDFDEHNELKMKIGYSFFGMPSLESGYDARQDKLIERIYNTIVEQSKLVARHRDQVIVSFIYACTAPLPAEKLKRARTETNYKPDNDFSTIPLFVLRKCTDSPNPCRLFIDHTGRVYETWIDYKKQNKLSKCEMYLPYNGRYTVDENGNVLLERCLSPACDLDAKILYGADIAGIVGGVASAGIFGAALIPTLAVPPVALAVGTGIGLVVGTYTIGRSIYNLVDRNKHKETMSFGNSEARAAYLTIVAGSLGFVGAGAQVALSQMIQRGVNISQGARVVVNTINITNLGASGVNIANSTYDVVNRWRDDNERPSALAILQLSTSVLFFGHAVYNFRSATTIIDETQAKVLQNYQDSLRSNRHRKTFTKMMKETIRQNDGNAAQGKAEVISTIRKIPNKDELFASLTRNNKEFNKKGIKFAADKGGITLNGVAIDMSELAAMNRNDGVTFVDMLPNKVEVKTTMAETNSIKESISGIFKNATAEDWVNLLLAAQKLTHMYKQGVRVMLMELVSLILKNVEPEILVKLQEWFPNGGHYARILHMVLKFVSIGVDLLDRQYTKWKTSGSEKDYSPIFEHINVERTKRYITLMEHVTGSLFVANRLKDGVLMKLLKYFCTWFSNETLKNKEKEDRVEKRSKHDGFYVHIRKNERCLVCEGVKIVPLR